MAAPPVVSEATRLVYDKLPELYRNADAAQAEGASNYPLLRYLDGMMGQLDTLLELIARFRATSLDERADLDGNTFGITLPWERFGSGSYGAGVYGDSDVSPADLVDPYRADGTWLAWLGQLVGVQVDAATTIEAQRAQIFAAPETWAHGTPGAIRTAVAKVLTGTKYVEVGPQIVGTDPEFGVQLGTLRAETDDSSTWGALEELAPTWAELHAFGSFESSAVGAVLLAADAERPAGSRVVHRYLD